MLDLSKVKVSSSPHIRSDETVRQIMLDVVIALLPALVVSIFVFGWRALILTVVSVCACIFFEWLYGVLLRRPNTTGDCSAVVSGMLLAFNVPVTAPLWLIIVGAAFAMVIVKGLFGGIGKNFMNPVLSARAFLFSWPIIMTSWVKIRTSLPLFATPVDVVTSATPLAALKAGMLPDFSIFELALGMHGGSLGETSAFALAAGGLYLLYRRVISLHIPVAYLGTVAALTFLFPRGGLPAGDFMLAHLLSGGLVLGAIFMATDYTTSPLTRKGQVIFGIGCGALTVVIRYFGSYPEGVSYSILLMNACVPLIERATEPKSLGIVKEKKAKKGAGAK